MSPSPSKKGDCAEHPAQDPQSLPEGITRFLYVAPPELSQKATRQVKYRFTCQRAGCGSMTIDRLAHLGIFIAKHAACSPAWQPLQQGRRESADTYKARLQQLFSFAMLPHERTVLQHEQKPAARPAKRQADAPADTERPRKKHSGAKSSITQYFGVRDVAPTGPQAMPLSGKKTANSTSREPQGSTVAPTRAVASPTKQTSSQAAEGKPACLDSALYSSYDSGMPVLLP